MSSLLAAEGGYQAFKLQGGEFLVLALSGAAAILAILVGFALMRGVLAADQGTPTMIEIATAIQEGAWAYLKRQFRTIGIILIPVAAVVFFTSTEVLKPNGDTALTFVQSATFRTVAFVIGGTQLFEEALPTAAGMVLTEIQRDYAGDTWFPKWERSQWKESQREAHAAADGTRFDFVLYERIT